MKTEVKKIIVVLSICFGFACVNGMMLWMGRWGWIGENMLRDYESNCVIRNGIFTPEFQNEYGDIYGICECLPGYEAKAYYNGESYEGEECVQIIEGNK